jgi:hypothetical protein
MLLRKGLPTEEENFDVEIGLRMASLSYLPVMILKTLHKPEKQVDFFWNTIIFCTKTNEKIIEKIYTK